MTDSQASRKPEKAFLIFSGSNPRAVITFLRALRKLEQKIVIIARSSSDMIFLSGFRHSVFAIRECGQLDLADIQRCIIDVQDKTGVNEFVICPSSEYLNLFLLKHRDILEGINCDVPLVDESIYRKISDKASSAKFVADHGLNVPKVFKCPERFTRPIVAKPKVNIDQGGQSRYPVFLMDSESFESFQCRSDKDAYFFQEFISGDSYYLMAYFSASGKVFLASQKNLAQQAGGKSIVVAESDDFHLSQTAQKTVEILKSENFFGLVMVEFLKCEDVFYFIELNPRLWGPLELVFRSGSQIVSNYIWEMLGLTTDIASLQPPIQIKKTRYLWLGGFAANRRVGEAIQWRNMTKFECMNQVMRSLFYDVYLRSDSWRIFLFEMTGYKDGKTQGVALE